MEGIAARDYPEELPVGYYLDNFQTILDFVDSHYGDILGADEKSFSRSFRSLCVDARRLYVRLMSRKGPLFRSDALVYKEITDIDAAAEQLNQQGFLEVDGSWELEKELAVLRKAEVLELICSCAQGPDPDSSTTALRALRKDQLVALVAVFDRLSRNPGANKSGFPDLILFSAGRERTAKSYELIEVKGPGDQLQINQKRWLKYFAKSGIPIESSGSCGGSREFSNVENWTE